VKTLLLALLVLASGAAAAPGRRIDDGGRSGRRFTVTLDVKDADVRDVLQSLKTQCGIRNMIVDKEVGGVAATFKFRDVPCETAFRVVFRTFGLASQPPVNAVLQVSAR
jgi:type II secretory pathway component HofQ